ncbi:MAG: M48 family metalloprotease [Myxococcota bacterium]|nr:M48 family metalloprotease [Myxococcota bacterium]
MKLHTLHFATLCSVLIAACGANDTSPPLFISESQEIETGQEVHRELVTEYDLLPRDGNEEVYAYVETLGQEVVQASLRPELTHFFYILDTELVNAFAAPGGYVYVTTGLMQNISSKAELASILAHEVGHISAYHGAKAMESSLALSLFSELLLGDSEATAEVVEFVVGTYLSTAHSQDQELQADRLGIEFVTRAAYNPWGIVDFFTWLDAITEASMFSFLSSHPEPYERILESSAEINRLGITTDDPSYTVDDPDTPYTAILDLLFFNRDEV